MNALSQLGTDRCDRSEYDGREKALLQRIQVRPGAIVEIDSRDRPADVGPDALDRTKRLHPASFEEGPDGFWVGLDRAGCSAVGPGALLRPLHASLALRVGAFDLSLDLDQTGGAAQKVPNGLIGKIGALLVVVGVLDGSRLYR